MPDLSNAIAVIGLAGKFPGAKDIKEFWDNLCNGVESIRTFNPEELASFGIDPEILHSPNYVGANGVLDGVDLFDAAFFGIPPREAELMDPQHRLFMECAWEALENAACDPDRYEGRIGVYAGIGINNYLLRIINDKNRNLLSAKGGHQILIGNDKDFIPTRISYKFNLRGPSVNINTACSSSLVAIHFACQSLLDFHCDMALAGGVAIQFEQNQGYVTEKGAIGSIDGHVRAFDEQAQGTVGGSGLGVVCLKRLEDAIQDGDFIYATVLSTAINNDGSLKVSYTAPSLEGQAMVITEAMALADVEPETVSYVEAHGTGTSLGDPIEIAALTRVFREKTDLKQFCAIGSVKTNIGHLDTAAGAASFIKTILALHYKKIPRSLNYEKPNPKIDFENSPFFVNTQLRDWPVADHPRRAGVSSFGIGGTNSHAILEEAPPRKSEKSLRPYQLVLYSAKTKEALAKMRANLLAYCKETPEFNLADLSYSLMVGRKEFSCRESIACENREEFIAALQADDSAGFFSGQTEQEIKGIVFVFPGEEIPYGDLGRDLYIHEPSFAENVDECLKIYRKISGQDIKESLFKQIGISPPALFIIQYGLARLLMEWGIKPTTLLGSSSGEFVAAAISGIFTLEQALNLITLRADFSAASDIGNRQNICADYKRLLASIAKNPPLIALSSGTSGKGLTPEEAISDSYWLNHLQDLGRFSETLQKLPVSQDTLYLTLGPETISHENDPADLKNKRIFAILGGDGAINSGSAYLDILGKLWCLGLKIDPSMFFRHEKRSRLPLPTYPFERQSFWIENAALNTKSYSDEKKIEDWFYVPVWRQDLILENKESDFINDTYVMFVDKEEYGREIALLLKKENKDIILVSTGEEYKKISCDNFEINPSLAADYDRLLEDLCAADIPFSQIIHAYNLSLLDHPGEEMLQAGFFSLMYIAQALGKTNINNQITLTILSSNAHAVLGDELHFPWKAVLLGPCKVIPQEYKEIKCRQIDITLDLLKQPNLARELSRSPEQLIIALRGNHRWLLSYEKYHLPESKKALPFKEKGVYLITGGLGGIGLAFAQFIAKNYKGRLILTGQSPFPEYTRWDDWLVNHPDENKTSRKIKQLKYLESLGAEIITHTCDVANFQEMELLVDSVRRKWGNINGVLHLAGVAGSGILQMKEYAKALDVLKPKIMGTMVLDRLCAGEPLDFFVLFSSTNAILGGLGQAEYCAANSFLDAFAHYQTGKRPYPTISINWDSWKELGMAHRLLVEPELNIDGDYIFKEVLSPAKNWYLSEHKLISQPILPGTAYLEILLQSLGKIRPNQHVELHNVYFQKPFIVEEQQEKELFTSLYSKNEQEFDFEMKGYSKLISSLDGHAKGSIKFNPSTPAMEIGLDIKRKFEIHSTLLQKGFVTKPSLIQFGSRFTGNCDVINWGNTESLGHFILPDKFLDDLNETVFHPALMDSATGFFLNRISENYLPFYYEKIQIFAPIPERIYSFAQHPSIENFHDEILKIDLMIFNEDWELLVLIQGYTLRRISNTATPPPEEEGKMVKTGKIRALRKELDLWIAPEDGLEAFSRILVSTGHPQIVVTTSEIKQEYENPETFSPSSGKNGKPGDTKGQSNAYFRPKLANEYQKATTSVEETIARIWQENLGIKNIGTNDDFLALGGDSLTATQIISQLRNAFQVDIPLSSVFEDSTINNTAKRINALLYAKNSMSLKNQSVAEEEEEIIL